MSTTFIGSTGSEETFTVPQNVECLEIECWGAYGISEDGGGALAPPGYCKATFNVAANQVLGVCPGTLGTVGDNVTDALGGLCNGICNGGGSSSAGSGGGAGSYARLSTDPLATAQDVWIVAGGGGGAGMTFTPGFVPPLFTRREGLPGGGINGSQTANSYDGTGGNIVPNMPGTGGIGDGDATTFGSAGVNGNGGDGCDLSLFIIGAPPGRGAGGGGGGLWGGGGGGRVFGPPAGPRHTGIGGGGSGGFPKNVQIGPTINARSGDSDYVTSPQNNSGSQGVVRITPVVCPCVAQGSLCQVRRGEQLTHAPIELLTRGDLLINRLNQQVELKQLIRFSIPSKHFVRISRSALGPSVPNSDLLIRAGHPLLVNGQEAMPEHILAPPFVSETTLDSAKTIFTIVTEKREFINIQGVLVATWSESGWRNMIENNKDVQLASFDVIQ